MGALGKANEDSAAVMLRQLEAYERPWVTASFEARSDIDFNNVSGLGVTFKIDLANIGNSIATHITIEAAIVPSTAISNDVNPMIAEQRDIEQRMKALESGYTLF